MKLAIDSKKTNTLPYLTLLILKQAKAKEEDKPK